MFCVNIHCYSEFIWYHGESKAFKISTNPLGVQSADDDEIRASKKLIEMNLNIN